MADIPEKLPSNLRSIILPTCKKYRTYNPDIVLSHAEEFLGAEEVALCRDFLTWVVANGKTFGVTNIQDVYQEWAAQA